MSPSSYEDGRKAVWRFHIQTFKLTSRKWGYDRSFPWIERGPIFEEDSDFMICRKRILVALTFCEPVRASRSSAAGAGATAGATAGAATVAGAGVGAAAPSPWLVLVLSTPNMSIRPLQERFLNGHEAFLSVLEMEIDDACEGLREASDKIGEAAVPPVSFLFCPLSFLRVDA